MRILFIDPLGDPESTGLNMGIAYCASSAIKGGHTVSVLDLVNIRAGEDLSRIRRAVESFRPDVVGLSVTNMSFNNSKSYAKELKRSFGGKLIVGGPEVSALRGRSLELMPEADIAVIGEGEITLAELLGALERGGTLSEIKGLVWRDGESIVVNRHREFLRDLDSIELPNYEAFGAEGMDVYPVLTSRGCPYGCSFCFSHLGRVWRPRSPEGVIEELKVARDRYGAKLFHVCDPSFNVDIERVEKFCRLLIENRLDMPWVIQGFRADKVTEDMMRILKKANCGRIWVGIETLEDDVFGKINKGETIDEIRRSIALMKKYDIEIFGYMLMGLPADTFKKTLRSFDKARALDLDLLAYSSCVPFTGTRIERWAKANARTLADSYGISSIGTRYSNIAFETDDFTKEERALARKILNIKSGSYNEPDMNSTLFKIKKWLLVLRYDFWHIFKRLKQSVDYRRKYKKSVDSINLKRGIYFSRLPDGTWGTDGARQGGGAPSKRFFLDLKRLTMSEAEG